MKTTDPGTLNEERYSMAYFVNVNGDTLVKPLTTNGSEARYPPVKAKVSSSMSNGIVCRFTTDSQFVTNARVRRIT